jgi:hypothetical protein
VAGDAPVSTGADSAPPALDKASARDSPLDSVVASPWSIISRLANMGHGGWKSQGLKHRRSAFVGEPSCRNPGGDNLIYAKNLNFILNASKLKNFWIIFYRRFAVR